MKTYGEEYVKAHTLLISAQVVDEFSGSRSGCFTLC